MTGSGLIGLDIGERRIGVARANKIAKIAEPITTIENNEEIAERIKEIADENDADTIVVGLPKNLNANTTKQTSFTKAVAKKIKQTGLNIVFADETLSSIEARERLRQNKKPYEKADIDSEAAAIILDNFMALGSQR